MPHRPAGEWHFKKRSKAAEEAIFGVLRLGGPDRLAAAKAGIARSTLALWRANDESFQRKCDAAEAEWELKRLSELDTAASNGDLKATMFSLERRRAADYGDLTRLDTAIILEEIRELQDELLREGHAVPSTAQMLKDLRGLKSGGGKKLKALPAPAPESLPEREVVDVGHTARYHK